MIRIVMLAALLTGCTSSSGTTYWAECGHIQSGLKASKQIEYESATRLRDGSSQQTMIFADGTSYEFDYRSDGTCEWVENTPS